jgi:DNA-binding NarL/FixJ family response regulator
MQLGDCGTILVVDGDDATRVAAARVATRLGCEVSAAEHAELLFERLDGVEPAAAVVAVELPGSVNGLEVMRELHERFGADLPVLLVSAERTTALDRTTGLMLGADDYLTKPLDPGELLARLRRSLRRSTNGHANDTRNGDSGLSAREREILALLAAGKTQSEIATELVISPKTVATHIQHLLSKLGVHSRAQAVAAAFRLGLVEPDVRAHLLVAHID